MKITPTLEECKKIAAEESYGVIPISTEMYADMTTPIEVLRILKKVSGHVYLLESAEADKRWGRYSFLGYDPLLEITCYNGMTTIKSELTSRTDSGDVRGIIRNVMEENKSPKLPGLPSFTGGLVGYFSYDYIKYSEPTLRLDAKDEEGFQDVNLMLFHKVIAFDNYRQKLILILNIKTDDLEINYHRAERELNNMKELLLNGEKAEHKLRTDFQPLFNEAAYCNMVEKAKHYIREGDIFQVVLSNRLEAEMEGSLLDAYRVLRTTNPSPYMFYFSGSDGEIVGASPETLVKLEETGRWCITYLPPGRNETQRSYRGSGQSTGSRTSGRRKGTFRTQYAGGSGTKRYRQDQPDWHRGSGKVYVHRALLSRDAHRIYGKRCDQRGCGCFGCGGCHPPRRNPVGSTEASGL